MTKQILVPLILKFLTNNLFKFKKNSKKKMIILKSRENI